MCLLLRARTRRGRRAPRRRPVPRIRAAATSVRGERRASQCGRRPRFLLAGGGSLVAQPRRRLLEFQISSPPLSRVFRDWLMTVFRSAPLVMCPFSGSLDSPRSRDRAHRMLSRCFGDPTTHAFGVYLRGAGISVGAAFRASGWSPRSLVSDSSVIRLGHRRIARPSTAVRAARPIVWIKRGCWSDIYPSLFGVEDGLGARIPGMSSPSRRRLIPISTSEQAEAEDRG